MDHLPLYRLEQMSSRWGATISRRTMSDWVETTATWLEPIYRHMHRELLASNGMYAHMWRLQRQAQEMLEEQGTPVA